MSTHPPQAPPPPPPRTDAVGTEDSSTAPQHVVAGQTISVDEDYVAAPPTSVPQGRRSIDDRLADAMMRGDVSSVIIPNENVIYSVEYVTDQVAAQGGVSSVGTLHLTNYRVIFVASEKSSYDDAADGFIKCPLGTIAKIEKYGRKQNKGNYGIEIICKDFRQLKFGFRVNSNHERRKFYETVQLYAFPGKIDRVFAFFHQLPNDSGSTNVGWGVYNPRREWARMNIPNEHWRISEVNIGFQLCETYPRLLIVPNVLSDPQIRNAAQFRSKFRFPVLSFVHQGTGAVMCRSAQPKVGVKRARSALDERLIAAIRDSNPVASTLYIFDCRPKANALANQAMGAGFEQIQHYTHCKLEFMGIENIHVMRTSLGKVAALCKDITDSNYLSQLQSTNWLRHVKAVLGASVRMAEALDKEGASILVHCSDGWDRTAQTCALVQLILDPHYRTFTGFQILCEKEWIWMGHRFRKRIGHGDKNSGDEQRSPIFVQFMDCVYQIMSQFPLAFEFNESYLIAIIDHMYSCRFGTFLGNCAKDRDVTMGKTPSLWAYLHFHRDQYLNPAYTQNPGPIYPRHGIQHLKLWTRYYMRWVGNHAGTADLMDSNHISKATTKLKTQVGVLQDTIVRRNRRLDSLETHIVHATRTSEAYQAHIDALQKKVDDAQDSLNLVDQYRGQIASLEEENTRLRFIAGRKDSEASMSTIDTAYVSDLEDHIIAYEEEVGRVHARTTQLEDVLRTILQADPSRVADLNDEQVTLVTEIFQAEQGGDERDRTTSSQPEEEVDSTGAAGSATTSESGVVPGAAMEV